jgi:hypothetical protein
MILSRVEAYMFADHVSTVAVLIIAMACDQCTLNVYGAHITTSTKYLNIVMHKYQISESTVEVLILHSLGTGQ